MSRFSAAVALVTVLLSWTVPSNAGDGVVLITSMDENTLSFYDAASNELVAVAPTGKGPREVVVSPDGRFAYVSDWGDVKNTISVYDVAKHTRINKIKITAAWGPQGLAVSGDGKSLFVTLGKSKKVAELALPSGEVKRVFDTRMRGSHQLVLTPDEKVLITANRISDNVTLFDLTTGERIRHVISGTSSVGPAVTPDGKELWVANQGNQTIAVIDLGSLKRVETLPCNGYPKRIRFGNDGRNAFISCPESGEVTVYNVPERRVETTIPTGNAPFALAIDKAGTTLYVTNVTSQTASVIDCKSYTVTAEFPIPPEAYGITLVE